MFKFNKRILTSLLEIRNYNFIRDLNSTYSVHFEKPIILEVKQIQPIYSKDIEFLYFSLELFDGELSRWCLLEETQVEKFIFSTENKLENGSVIFLKKSSKTLRKNCLDKCSPEIKNAFENEILIIIDFYIIGNVPKCSAIGPSIPLNNGSLFTNAVYIASNPHRYTKLNCVGLENTGKLLDIMGIVSDIEGSKQFAGAISSKCFKFELIDNTCSRVSVVVWGNKADSVKLRKEDICIINNGKLKFFQNRPVIYVMSESTLTRVPELHSSELIEDLRSWLKENKIGVKPKIKIHN